jgi:hypothetical protein
MIREGNDSQYSTETASIIIFVKNIFDYGTP